MARLGSQATAGYFPTPDRLIPAIASLVTIERDAGDPIFLDPCAGTGAAILGLAGAVLGLEPARVERYCHAIELESTRAETLRRRLTRPPCWPVRAIWRMTKKVLSRSSAFTKRMICG